MSFVGSISWSGEQCLRCSCTGRAADSHPVPSTSFWYRHGARLTLCLWQHLWQHCSFGHSILQEPPFVVSRSSLLYGE